MGQGRIFGGKMEVGDLVKVKLYPSETGVILAIASKQVQCLWQDGDVSWCGVWQLEVVCK